MKIKSCILFAFVTFYGTIVCNAQLIDVADSISRQKADEVLIKYFNPYLKTNKILLFSISDMTYYVVLEKKSSYEEYILKLDSAKSSAGPVLVSSVKKPKAILRKAFCTDIYHKGYVTRVENPELQQGNLSYFVLRDVNGDRFGEYRESVIIKPVPINKKVYSYLLSRITSESR